MEKLNVTVRVDKEHVDTLDQLGEYFDRDRSYLINQAIERFIAQQQWQIDEVNKAIEEADAGRVMTHAEFAKKVKSWPL